MPVVSTRVVFVLGLLALPMSCKETQENSDQGSGASGSQEVVDAKRRERPEFYAADAAYIQKNSNFFYRIWDETFTRKLDDLPANGDGS